jgi:hypothetical protein
MFTINFAVPRDHTPVFILTQVFPATTAYSLMTSPLVSVQVLLK